jgi:hypothetical protein
MEEVVPGGRCEGGHVQKGSYNITKGGMYALVFGMMSLDANADNTFSVNTSKTVFFILSNHPVSLPPLLRDPSTDLSSITDSSLATTFSGILYKKRRKKLQGTRSKIRLTQAMRNAISHSLEQQENSPIHEAHITHYYEEQYHWLWQR